MTEQTQADELIKTKSDGRALTRLWDWIDIVPTLVIFFFLFIALSIAAFFLAGGSIDLADGSVINGDPFLTVLYSLIGTMFAMVLPYFGINAIRKRHSLQTLGLGSMPAGWLWTSIGLGIAAAVVRLAIAYGLLALFPWLEEGAEALNELFAFEEVWKMLIIGFAATFIVPIYEEIFFRGLLHNGLANRLGMWGTILVSSTLFGLFHGFPIQIITALLFGLFVGWLYEKTDSLWPGIICHVTNNGLVMLLSIIGLLFGIE